MSYLELLNLTREPFSNSPDPDAYYRTPTHEACLHRLEIAIRLRRGLNVVLGEVGTGKSTLCRCLLRALGGEERMDVFLLLDPGFEDADAFVRHLCELLTGQRPPEETARRDCVSLIQNRVFDRALNEGRNLVLFIDEGQKLAPAALEVLRELLNFETNTEKLLQIVIFGQPELAPIIEGMPNFKASASSATACGWRADRRPSGFSPSQASSPCTASARGGPASSCASATKCCSRCW